MKRKKLNLQHSAAGVQLKATKRFLRAAGKKLGELEQALLKIGTGLGNEHQLTTGQLTIRTDKGGRIVYDYNAQENYALLLNYSASHDYNKLLR